MKPEPISSKEMWLRAAQILGLVGLICLVLREDIGRMVRLILREPEAAHALALVVMIPIIVASRRALLADSAHWTRWAGVVLLLLALGFYLATQWPYNFGSARRAAIIPAVAGAILTVGGARIFWHLLPIVFMVALAVPLGSRYYAALVIRPETITLEIAQVLLDFIPGVATSIEGSDLVYVRDGEVGAIALGYKYRGAAMIFAMTLMAFFMIYARVRVWWQAIIMLLTLGPIVFIGNIFRMFCWGLATIVLGAAPTDGRPYIISIFAGIGFVYLLSGGVSFILRHLIVAEETAAPPDESAPKEAIHAT